MRSSSTAESSKKGEIGRRIRAVRVERSLTLRQVAGRALLSATHISEIERGHTTPTVGALVRIAEALGREPHFFLEAECLPEVSVVRRSEAERRPLAEVPGGSTESLTRGIPGGRLFCSRLTVEPHASAPGSPLVLGEMGGYVLRGRLEIHAGDGILALGPGDGFHLSADLPHSISNPGDEPAEVLWVTTHPANSSR
jgi:transcriptional regulator with XRE-family HTH domain